MQAAGAPATGAGATGAEATRFDFGSLPDGRSVPAVRLVNHHGVAASVIAYGATLQSLVLPDRTGRPADITLGYGTPAEYLAKPQFFGASVGRYANRIAGGRFTLDGKTWRLPLNDGDNALHGGPEGFDKTLWEILDVTSGTTASVRLGLVSPGGDQGYPGRLTVEATYSLSGADVLTIAYEARTDAPTIVNLTSHAYWNLSGEGSAGGALGAELTIPAQTFLPTDAGSIPTGELRPVAGTPFDFRAPHVIEERVRDGADEQILLARGYDHTFVLEAGGAASAATHLAARAADPGSGRGFELWTTAPGVQLYSGNSLDGTSRGKAGRAYRQGDGFALEPQLFPDTPNQPAFGTARLDPGEVYRSLIEYRFFSGG
ncbi:MAG TPA: aldose epimerase family protein [Caulobacteraceae bacterium]|jgi:aldose 1-epimerase|nr:aldose epimerase family protein [Caulobacteraceae bacterium]